MEKMNIQSDKLQLLVLSIGLSVLVHLLVLLSLGRFGNYNFTRPVNPLQAVMVELAKTPVATAPTAEPRARKDTHASKPATDAAGERNLAPAQAAKISAPPALSGNNPADPEPVVVGREKMDGITGSSGSAEKRPSGAPSKAAFVIAPPLRTAGEFLTSENEKLSYLISLQGLPVGNMELEAVNKNGEVRITLRTRTNAVFSGIYPVDDTIETRHVAGNFIITNIKQHEGTFSSDVGFTIFLRDMRVFWIDRIRKRYSNETIPNSDVLDTLSSLYYLRNRPLQPGKTEILHIYDGDIYAPVPVEIVRQEQIRLRNFKKVDTLLLRHVKQKDGIFKRAGDMLIWLTNDENRVPVRIETTTLYGKVTVELVSAETEQPDDPEGKPGISPISSASLEGN